MLTLNEAKHAAGVDMGGGPTWHRTDHPPLTFRDDMDPSQTRWWDADWELVDPQGYSIPHGMVIRYIEDGQYYLTPNWWAPRERDIGPFKELADAQTALITMHRLDGYPKSWEVGE